MHYKNVKKGALLISVLLIILLLTILLTSLVVQVRSQKFYTLTEKQDVILKNFSYSTEDLILTLLSTNNNLLYISKTDSNQDIADGSVITLNYGLPSTSDIDLSGLKDLKNNLSTNGINIYSYYKNGHLILAFLKEGKYLSVLWVENQDFVKKVDDSVVNKKTDAKDGVKNITLKIGRLNITFPHLYLSYNNMLNIDTYNLGNGRIIPAKTFRLKVNTAVIGTNRFYYTDNLFARDLLISSSLNTGGASSISASGHVFFDTLDELGRNNVTVGEFNLGAVSGQEVTVDLRNATDYNLNYFAFGNRVENQRAPEIEVKSGNLKVLTKDLDGNSLGNYKTRIYFGQLYDEKGTKYVNTTLKNIESSVSNITNQLTDSVGMNILETSPSDLKSANDIIKKEVSNHVNVITSTAPQLPVGAYIMVDENKVVYLPPGVNASEVDIKEQGNDYIINGKSYSETSNVTIQTLSKAREPIVIKDKIEDDSGNELIKFDKNNFIIKENVIIGKNQSTSSYFYFTNCPNTNPKRARIYVEDGSEAIIYGAALVKGSLNGEGGFFVKGDGSNLTNLPAKLQNEFNITYTDSVGVSTTKQLKSGDIATQPESQLASTSQDIALYADNNVYLTDITTTQDESITDPFLAQVTKWGLISIAANKTNILNSLPNNLDKDNVEDLNKWDKLDRGDKLDYVDKGSGGLLNLTANFEPTTNFNPSAGLGIVSFKLGGTTYTLSITDIGNGDAKITFKDDSGNSLGTFNNIPIAEISNYFGSTKVTSPAYLFKLTFNFGNTSFNLYQFLGFYIFLKSGKIYDNSSDLNPIIIDYIDKAFQDFKANKRKFANDIGVRYKKVRFISKNKDKLKNSYIAGAKDNSNVYPDAGYIAYLGGVGNTGVNYKDANLSGLIYGKNFYSTFSNNSFKLTGSLFFTGDFSLNGVKDAVFIFDPKYVSNLYGGSTGKVVKVLHTESRY